LDIFADAGFIAGMHLRIIVGEDARHGLSALSDAIVKFLHDEGIAGASVFRGVEGFGSHQEIHLNRVLSFNAKMPILIEAVDSEERISEILPRIEKMVDDGIVTVERISYRRYVQNR